jgi:hypothetical protein
MSPIDDDEEDDLDAGPPAETGKKWLWICGGIAATMLFLGVVISLVLQIGGDQPSPQPSVAHNQSKQDANQNPPGDQAKKDEPKEEEPQPETGGAAVGKIGAGVGKSNQSERPRSAERPDAAGGKLGAGVAPRETPGRTRPPDVPDPAKEQVGANLPPPPVDVDKLKEELAAKDAQLRQKDEELKRLAEAARTAEAERARAEKAARDTAEELKRARERIVKFDESVLTWLPATRGEPIGVSRTGKPIHSAPMRGLASDMTLLPKEASGSAKKLTTESGPEGQRVSLRVHGEGSAGIRLLLELNKDGRFTILCEDASTGVPDAASRLELISLLKDHRLVILRRADRQLTVCEFAEAP